MKPVTSLIGGALALLAGTASGHSWLDCIGLDIPYHGPQQFFGYEFYTDYCIGYPRGYPSRFNTQMNDLYTILIERRGQPHPELTKVCGTKTQAPGNYSTEFPKTKVKAGTKLKLWYEMDNHRDPSTVKLWTYGEPKKAIEVYSELSSLKPIYEHEFATDANCIDRNYPNTFCWAYWTVPEHWEGEYSFLWNWWWDQNKVGEEYNSCFELEVTPADGAAPNRPTLPEPTPKPVPDHPLKCRPKHQ